jgi:hypothetical protein
LAVDKVVVTELRPVVVVVVVTELRPVAVVVVTELRPAAVVVVTELRPAVMDPRLMASVLATNLDRLRWARPDLDLGASPSTLSLAASWAGYFRRFRA